MSTVDKDTIKNQIIMEFSKTIEQFGLNPLEARLFAFLYLSKEALTLDEMSEGLGKSKTAIHTNIRNLSKLQLVQPVWKKGVRKDLYQTNSSLFKTFMKFYIKKWMEVTKDQKVLLESIRDQLDMEETKNPSTDMEELSNRLKEIITFHNKIESVYKNVKDI